MTTYKYKAITRDGADVTGVIEAYDEFDAVEKIKQSCILVNSIEEVKGTERPSGDIFASRKVRDKILAMVCSQFSIILSAGLPIFRCVELIAEQTTDKTMKKILLKVAEDVAQGNSLARSIEANGKQLPTTFIETVRAGEESGTLETSFKRLHDYYDKASKTRSKLISALTYPVFLLIVAVGVIVLIMVVAVPVFTSMYSDVQTLPAPTKMLIGISNFFTDYGLYLLIGIAVIFAGLKYYSKTENGGIKLAEIRLKLPIFSKISLMKSASQFAGTMSTMLAAGLPMVKAVAITSHVIDNAAVGHQLGITVSGLEEGKRLGDCMRKCEHFPNLLIEMTSVGEETGSMENTLDVICDYYNMELEAATAKATSLLEPCIILVLALFVVLILLAVYMPMFSMYEML